MAISRFGKKKAPSPDYIMLSRSHFELHGEFNLEDVLNLCFSAQLHFMRSTLSTVPEEHREEAKGRFFDIYNESASKLLEMFAPELEIHPGLTAEAILKAENAILDEFKRNNPDAPAIDPMVERQMRIEDPKEAPDVR